MDIANLLRPKTFDDIVGQDHLCAKDAPLRILAQKGLLGHSFFMEKWAVARHLS